MRMKEMAGAVALAAILLSAAGAGAQEADAARERTLTATGQGSVTVAMDEAVLVLGVEQEADEAAAAMQAMSGALQGVFAELDAAGIAEADRQTVGLSLDPIVDIEQEDGRQRRTTLGYRASSMVQLTLGDVDAVGALIDRLTQAGANRLSHISFDVADRSAAIEEARRRAVEDAQARAELYAGSAGVTLGEIVNISEGGAAEAMPVGMRARAADAMMSVPVASGTADVTAEVTVTWRIGDGGQ